MTYSAGFATGATCPNCQTPEEAAADLPETGGAYVTTLGALSEEQRVRVVLDGVWQRVAAVVTRRNDLAKMAGETPVAVNVEEWAEEALRGCPLMDGMPAHFWDAVRPIAQDDVREMLGMK